MNTITTSKHGWPFSNYRGRPPCGGRKLRWWKGSAIRLSLGRNSNDTLRKGTWMNASMMRRQGNFMTCGWGSKRWTSLLPILLPYFVMCPIFGQIRLKCKGLSVADPQVWEKELNLTIQRRWMKQYEKAESVISRESRRESPWVRNGSIREAASWLVVLKETVVEVIEDSLKGRSAKTLKKILSNQSLSTIPELMTN